VTVDLDEGAGIGAWDIRPVRHAVGAVMRRRPEAYHDVLRQHDDEDASETPHDAAATSIHEAVRVKEAGLAGRLFYDRYERRSGLVRFLSLDATPESWANAAAPELGDAVDGSFDLVELTDGSLTVRRDSMVATKDMHAQVRATKRVRVAGDRRQPTLELTLDLEHVGATRLDARVGIEWTTTMLGGGHNPAAWWEFAGDRSPHDGSGQASGVERFAQGNDYIGLAIETTVSIPADAWWAPVETVSNSEQGFERVYQGSGWLLSWPLALDPGDRWSVVVANTVPTDRDRAVEA
jgi:alpha-amylase